MANYEFGYGKYRISCKYEGNFINVLSKKLAKKFLITLTMQFSLAKWRNGLKDDEVALNGGHTPANRSI